MSQAMKHVLLGLLALVLSGVARADCFDDAATRYRLPVAVLRAIAQVESGGNPRAHNVNADRSEDIGVMQINSSWLLTLRRYGYTREHLLDACTNITVGAWILAGNVAQQGWNWDAIGAYNAASPHKRLVYAHKVWAQLQRAPNASADQGR